MLSRMRHASVACALLLVGGLGLVEVAQAQHADPAAPPGDTPLMCSAPATGHLTGSVSDWTGGVLPGTRIVARHEGSGAALATVTDLRGAFRISCVPPGAYSISAELYGFGTREVPAHVQADSVATVSFALPLDPSAVECGLSVHWDDETDTRSPAERTVSSLASASDAAVIVDVDRVATAAIGSHHTEGFRARFYLSVLEVLWSKRPWHADRVTVDGPLLFRDRTHVVAPLPAQLVEMAEGGPYLMFVGQDSASGSLTLVEDQAFDLSGPTVSSQSWRGDWTLDARAFIDLVRSHAH